MQERKSILFYVEFAFHVCPCIFWSKMGSVDTLVFVSISCLCHFVESLFVNLGQPNYHNYLLAVGV